MSKDSKCCSHCKLTYPLSSLNKTIIDDKEYYFCCNGCKLAFSLLMDMDLESFYDKLGSNTLNTKSINNTSDLIDYSSPSFKEKYIKEKNGLYEVHLIIEGVVCAACIWLNEKILCKLDGVNEVSIHYTNHRAKILYDPTKISLQEIIDSIKSIGYKPIVYDHAKKKDITQSQNTAMYIKIAVAIFCTMNIMWVNVGQYSGHFLGIDNISSSIMNLASFILATPTLFFCGSGFYKQAYKGIKNGVIGMDTLVVTGTSLVYFYSIYAWLSNSGHTYFESVCMIILFVLSAKFLESISRKRAGDNLDKLNSILPLEAKREDGSTISVHAIKVGDRLLALPGEMLAVDSILVSKSGIFDYKNISGESGEVEKRGGDTLLSGSIALHSPIIYQATKEFSESSMSKLSRLLEESEFSTPKIANSALRIAGHFSKVVLSIAFFGFLYYFFMNKSGFEHALLIAVSVIVIACPCALALATPIASVVGLNQAFKHHIIFTKASFLESLARADVVLFDKTGTLTNGDMKVALIERFGGFGFITQSLRGEAEAIHNINKQIDCNAYARNDKRNNKEIDSINLIAGKGFKAHIKDAEIIAGSMQFFIDNNIELNIESKGDDIANSDNEILKALMQKNPHPISKAILSHIDSKNKHNTSKQIDCHAYARNDNGTDSMKAITIHCEKQSDKANQNDLQSKLLPSHCERSEAIHNIAIQTNLLHNGNIDIDSINQKETESIKSISTKFCIAYKNKNEKTYTLAYIFHLQDSIKDDALQLISTLKTHNKQTAILSGDKDSVVSHIANKLNIESFYANKTPKEKADIVKDYIENGKSVVMIGDGLNDSLALKYAQVGIVMGSGSDIAINNSDVIILDSKLSTLEHAFIIAKKTLLHIKQNLAISLIYNAVAIPFALCGYVIPLFAALFMSISSLSVVLNSLRLNLLKFKS